MSDLRFAFRSFRRRPAYAVMVVVILALGIGANTAMFSVVDAVLLRGLPYRDVDSLVVVFADGTARGQGPRLTTTAGDFLDWRGRLQFVADTVDTGGQGCGHDQVGIRGCAGRAVFEMRAFPLQPFNADRYGAVFEAPRRVCRRE